MGSSVPLSSDGGKSSRPPKWVARRGSMDGPLERLISCLKSEGAHCVATNLMQRDHHRAKFTHPLWQGAARWGTGLSASGRGIGRV